MFGGNACWCAIACFMLLSTAGAFHVAQDPNRKLLTRRQSDDTYSGFSEADLPRRPMLLYIHLEKVAGNFVGQLFQESVPNNVLVYHQVYQAIQHVPQDYFVVMGMRNPCMQVLSEWNYLCEIAWAYEEGYLPEFWLAPAEAGKNMLQRGNCPKYSAHPPKTTEWEPSSLARQANKTIQVDDINAAGFAASMKDDYNMYMFGLEKLFNSTLHSIGADRVNCWVYVENMEESTRKCLQEYQQLTGSEVYWDKFVTRLNRGGENAAHHSDCSAYMTPEVEDLLQNRNSFLFKYFEYKSCCN